MLLGAAPARAQQHVEVPGSIDPPKSDLERKMRDEMACTCGSCGHEPLSKCICGQAAQMRDDLRADISAGQTHDQIISSWIQKYGGQQFLTMPLDTPINRLAWLFPYLLGGVGVVGVAFVAKRWSSQHDDDSAGKPTEDAAMNDRLDDELRNLD
jgi:cytochrome c-type biogenesis protein CcmH/NrfF